MISSNTAVRTIIAHAICSAALHACRRSPRPFRRRAARQTDRGRSRRGARFPWRGRRQPSFAVSEMFSIWSKAGEGLMLAASVATLPIGESYGTGASRIGVRQRRQSLAMAFGRRIVEPRPVSIRFNPLPAIRCHDRARSSRDSLAVVAVPALAAACANAHASLANRQQDADRVRVREQHLDRRHERRHRRAASRASRARPRIRSSRPTASSSRSARSTAATSTSTSCRPRAVSRSG